MGDETVNNVLEYQMFNVQGEGGASTKEQEGAESSLVAMPIGEQLPKAQAFS